MNELVYVLRFVEVLMPIPWCGLGILQGIEVEGIQMSICL